MRHAILSVFLVTLCAAAATSVSYATTSGGQQSVSGVVRTRLGNLRRDDQVVVDIPGVADLQRDVSSVTGRLGTVESGLSSVTGRVSVLEAAVADLGGDIPGISGLTERVGAVESGLSSVTGRVDAVESDLSSVTGRVAAVESDLASATSRVGAVESGLSSVTGRVAAVESDLSELMESADKRWHSTVASLEDLSFWATNTFELVASAHARSKALEAWQYTNAVSRSDLVRGMTDWAVTPMWPLGHVDAGQVLDGPDAGKWSLFPTGAAHTASNALLPAIDGAKNRFGDVVELLWPDASWRVEERWTNALDKLGFRWTPDPGNGYVTAHFDARAARTRVVTMEDVYSLSTNMAQAVTGLVGGVSERLDRLGADFASAARLSLPGECFPVTYMAGSSPPVTIGGADGLSFRGDGGVVRMGDAASGRYICSFDPGTLRFLESPYGDALLFGRGYRPGASNEWPVLSVAACGASVVPAGRTVNGKALTNDVTLTGADIAYNASTTVSAKIASVDSRITAESTSRASADAALRQDISELDATVEGINTSLDAKLDKGDVVAPSTAADAGKAASARATGDALLAKRGYNDLSYSEQVVTWPDEVTLFPDGYTLPSGVTYRLDFNDAGIPSYINFYDGDTPVGSGAFESELEPDGLILCYATESSIGGEPQYTWPSGVSIKQTRTTVNSKLMRDMSNGNYDTAQKILDAINGELALKANDADVIHKAGNETKTGSLTIFNAGGNGSVGVMDVNQEDGTVRSSLLGSDKMAYMEGNTAYVYTFPSSSGAFAIAAPDSTAGNLAALSAAGNPTDSGLSKDDVESLFLAQYYPDGSVKSAAEFTAGIKYDDPDTTNRTITVKPFCNTGTAENDNSDFSGRIVIPPFVDAQGNGYVADDDTRYKVVGISRSSSGSVAGNNNTNLTAIAVPNTVTTIGGYAFSGCTALNSVFFHAATGIGDYAFAHCKALVSVSLPAAETIGDHAFYDCASLASVSLPAATSIGGHAFNGCASLASIALPVATNIGSYAFYYCTSLASVSLPAATSIGNIVFDSCTSLTSVSLPAATIIGRSAFDSCTSLTSVSLPAVTSIWSYAFYYCRTLASVDFGDTPRSSVPSLGEDVFVDVPLACKIIVPYAQYGAWKAASGWSALQQEFVRHAEKADKPATFTTGNLAKLDADGNPTDSGLPSGNLEAGTATRLGASTAAALYGTALGRNTKAAAKAVAVGACDDVLPTSASGQGSVAVGFRARAEDNKAAAISIGAFSKAKGEGAVAIGGAAQGSDTPAVAAADGAAQIGPGTNDVANSFRFRSTVVVDGNGKIPLSSTDMLDADTGKATFSDGITVQGSGASAMASPSAGSPAVGASHHSVTLNSDSIVFAAAEPGSGTDTYTYTFPRESGRLVVDTQLVRRYPMFIIDLNPDDQRIWNHFELKASTNNFTNTTSTNMLFFAASTVNGVTNAEFDVGYPYDWCRLYVLSGRAGGGTADPRSWTRIRNTAELDTYAPLAVAVIVDMEMLKRGQGSGWLYEDNEEIVWSYLRIGLDSAERDQAGAQCWRPVSPVRWYRKLPQWAEQECTSFSTSGIQPYEAPLDGDE